MRRERKLVGLAMAAVLLGGAAFARSQDVATTQSREQELLAVLRSETPESEKAITCKLLAIYGSPAAVGDLAALLGNERLASWARIALEPVPGPEADAALRTTLLKTLGSKVFDNPHVYRKRPIGAAFCRPIVIYKLTSLLSSLTTSFSGMRGDGTTNSYRCGASSSLV